MVEGLSHLTFIVQNLDAMERVFVEALGATKIYDSGAESFSLSPERFYLLGPEHAPLWLVLMQGEPLPSRTYNHVAFKIPEADLEAYRVKLKALDLGILPGRPRVAGEGQSIYFYGPDNHLFELHTGTLPQRLSRYAEGKT